MEKRVKLDNWIRFLIERCNDRFDSDYEKNLISIFLIQEIYKRELTDWHTKKHFGTSLLGFKKLYRMSVSLVLDYPEKYKNSIKQIRRTVLLRFATRIEFVEYVLNEIEKEAA